MIVEMNSHYLFCATPSRPCYEYVFEVHSRYCNGTWSSLGYSTTRPTEEGARTVQPCYFLTLRKENLRKENFGLQRISHLEIFFRRDFLQPFPTGEQLRQVLM
jgi:hypothetical protein